MDVFEAIKKRREITTFNGEEIPHEVLKKIVNAGYLSPAGNNLPSREFILVTNQDKLKQLANSTPYVKWLDGSAAAIVITGRPDVSKYWLQDASIASAFIWLEAVELGIGAAFGAIYHSEDELESKKREDFVRGALDVPNDRRIIAILGFGYPLGEPKEKKLLPKEELIHYETF